MKKVFLFSFMVATALLTTSCGGGSKVNEAISQAEQEVAIAESPQLGKLPSLQMQYDAAKKAVSELMKVEGNSLDELSKSGEERKSALDELHKTYREKVIAEGKALDGKVIKVDFNSEYFQAVTATLKTHEISESESLRPVGVELKMTLAKPLPKNRYGGSVMWGWKYLDAQGNELSGGAAYIESSDPAMELEAGGVWTYTIESINMPYGEKGLKFETLSLNTPGI